MHGVQVFGAARRARRALARLDPGGERQARRIGERRLGDLVTESISLEQQHRDAIGEVELRRGHPFGTIGPTGMLERRLRAADDDALDIVRSERPARLHEPDGVERRVIGADAGIEFERDAHRLETLAKTGGELGAVEAILRPREGRAEPALKALEDISDAGETPPGEGGAAWTALR